MMNFMPDDLSREHRQLLREEADKARLVKLAHKEKNAGNRRLPLLNVLRLVSNSLEWLWRRAPVSTKSKPAVAGR